MPAGKDLEKLLLKLIKKNGKITFKDFMDMALYYPQLGYYTKTGIDIGGQGDFYTAPNVHPVFGWCLAEQFYEMWTVLGKPVDFEVVELGPGTGRLAKDILYYLEENFIDCFNSLRYRLVEKSPALKSVQEETLLIYKDKVKWGFPEKPVAGVIFGNEFFDALPVHRVIKLNGKLKEIYVGLRDGTLTDVYGQLSENKILEYLEVSGVTLKEGQQIEVCLDAITWLKRINDILSRGFLVVIDYGYLSSEIQWPHRNEGTIMCYYQHRANEKPYVNLGEQDITAHVNFSALKSFGKKIGLEPLGYTNQMKFLVNLGIFEKINLTGSKAADIKQNLALKRLLMPEGMGEIFKILILQKGLRGVALKSLKNFG